MQETKMDNSLMGKSQLIHPTFMLYDSVQTITVTSSHSLPSPPHFPILSIGNVVSEAWHLTTFVNILI